MRDAVAYTVLAFVFLLGLGALWLALELIEHPRQGQQTADRVEGTVFMVLAVAILVIAVVGASSVASWR